MRKFSVQFLVLFLITMVFAACQNNNSLSTETGSVSQTTPASNTPTTSADNSTTSSSNSGVKNTTVKLGDLTVSGLIDTNTINNSVTSAQPSASSVVAKGILIKDDGFALSNIEMKITDTLLVYNSTSSTVKIKAVENGKACPVLGSEFSVTAAGTNQYKFTAPAVCTLTNEADSSQKMTLTIR